MTKDASLFATVHGRVQGVNFRAFVQRQARGLGLKGYVRNLPGGRSVELRAEGNSDNLEELVRNLYIGPPGSRVEKVDTEWAEYTGEFTDFKVRF